MITEDCARASKIAASTCQASFFLDRVKWEREN
jgi:hypothetical protein